MGSIRANAAQANVIATIEVKGNFMFDPAKHPDFLGAILGTGVVRGKVGDILVQGETGAQIMCDPELIEHFEMALTQVRGCRVWGAFACCIGTSQRTIPPQVRTVPVQTRSIPLDQLKARPPKVEEVSSVEASLRLDALASAGWYQRVGMLPAPYPPRRSPFLASPPIVYLLDGWDHSTLPFSPKVYSITLWAIFLRNAGFRVSRSKMADLVKSGDVRVNWRATTRASAELKQGDVVACSGKGRIEVKAISMTKKEKYSVTLTRYV